MQADVARLKQSINKTTCSTLTLVGTKLEGQSWWKQQLFFFLKEGPAREQWGERLQEALTAMPGLKLVKDDVAELAKFIKQLHFILDSFRLDVVKDVVGEVCMACKRLAEEALLPASSCNVVLLSSLEACFQQLMALLPDQQDLAKSCKGLAECMRAKQQYDQVGDIVASCKQLLAKKEEKPEITLPELTEVLDEMNHLCLSFQEPVPTQSDGDAEMIKMSWKTLVQLVTQCCLGPGGSVVEEGTINTVLYILQNLPDLVSVKIDKAGAVADMLAGAIEYKGKMLQMGQDTSALSAQAVMQLPNVLEVLKGMRRGQMKMEQFKAINWEEMGDEAKSAWQRFLELEKAGEACCKDVLEALRQQHRNQVDNALKNLHAISGGKPGGKWSEGLKHNMKFNTIMTKFKEGTLFSVEVVGLLEAMTALTQVTLDINKGTHTDENTLRMSMEFCNFSGRIGEVVAEPFFPWATPEALKKYEDCLAVVDKLVPNDVKEKTAAILKEARVTKCSLALMQALQQEKDTSKLRSTVVSELKELKAHVGRAEADACLFPPLKDKAEKVMEGG